MCVLDENVINTKMSSFTKYMCAFKLCYEYNLLTYNRIGYPEHKTGFLGRKAVQLAELE